MSRFALASLTAVLCACGGGSSAPTSSSSPNASSGAEIGTYTLVSLDGRALPASIAEGGTQVEVISGSITLSAGGVVRTSTVFRTSPGAAPATREVSGTYRIQGNSLTFSYANGGTNAGTLSSDQLQVTNEGVAWLYRRT